MSRVAIVTGGTSGIGLAAARALAKSGAKVYALSRRGGDFDFMTCLKADVSSEADCRAAVEAVLKAEGKIDILICNAGMGISGALEFTDAAASRRLMDVNLFGADNMLRCVLPGMRMRKSGSVVFLSSIAGPLPIPYQAWYSAGKAAILAYAKALRNEVRAFGIAVSCVLPGDTKTGFTAAREKSAAGNAEYGGMVEKSVARMEKDETNGTNPAVTGRIIAAVAQKKHPAPMYAVGFMYKAFLLIARLLPERFVSWGIWMMYGK